jgi:thiamine-monophosphate kinase
MRLKDLGERRLIAWIRRHTPHARPDVILGIGDDAAILRVPKALLLTQDLLVEDVDFRRALHPPRLLGRKALNVNLSDIAAMGGRPLHALLGLALPGAIGQAWLGEFMAGFREAASQARVVLAGGDVSAAARILISVTVTGEGRRFVTRSGAEPGDLLFASGTLGDAAMGLRLLEQGLKPRRNGSTRRLFKAFLDPAPRLELGRLLAQRNLATAMIDISDGLAVDLFHICEESEVGAELELTKLPISRALARVASRPLDMALGGGEDFELLFTVRPANFSRLRRLGRRFKLTEVGRITAGKRIVAIDASGNKRPLKIKGYEHFR